MRIYLDICCFNRPFDDQSQLRIKLEAEAKMAIQEDIRSGKHELVWSYIMDYENQKNPFQERREQIAKWRIYAVEDVEESDAVLATAKMVGQTGIKRMDSLHVACAVKGAADCFLTTDEGILKRANLITAIKITDPIGFIKMVSI